MLKNYFKIAFRNLSNNKAGSFINIFGLAAGMAVFLLITMYCMNELSCNKFYPQHEYIYQIEIGNGFHTMAPLGIMIKNNIPDFEKIVRVDYDMAGGRSPLIQTDNGKKIKVKDVVFADPEFFQMFNLPAVYGDPAAALNEPFSIVLTRTTALNLFGTDKVVGKSFLYVGDRNGQPRIDLKVTAVVQDVPDNSTISFSAVGSLSTMYAYRKYGYDIDEDWRNWMYETFVIFKHPDANNVTHKINKLWMAQEKILEDTHEPISLIPFDNVFFHNNSKRQFILFLQLIGIFILAIAIINFINLTIAKSGARAKEIGIRKVTGADRAALIKQFLGESVLTCLLAAVSSLMIIELIKPYFFKIIDKQILFSLLHRPEVVLILIAGIILIGIISGLYPAIILSAFKPAAILKSEITKGKKGSSLRHILIVFQFAVSIALIICTLMVSRQVEYLKTRDLGFNYKNIIHFNQSQSIGQKYEVFKQKLLTNPDITAVSRSNGALGEDLPIGTETEFNGIKKRYIATTADPDFIPVMKIEMIDGRQFSWDIQSDKNNTAIVNETFVKEFGLEKPVGTQIDFLNNFKPKIIGVMKDFHYNSFRQKVGPAAVLWIDWNLHINVRISNLNVSRTIQYIRDTWNELSPEVPFEFEFLDKTYGALYTSEEHFQSIINSFSVIAILIACLGLLGLVSLSVHRRRKEIGIRKILGASVDSIVLTLTEDFLRWVALANTIAWPAAWYVMNKWLQDFAYRAELTWWMFALSGGIALVIALATVSFQAIKAATANPVESLRYE